MIVHRHSRRWRDRCGALLAMSAFVAVNLAASPHRAAAQGATTRLTVRLAPVADSLVVSLLTIGPGDQIFDRFGHSAIRVRNAATGLDSAWNWGMYDFAAPNFITRFLTGDTQYWMAGFPAPLLVNFYGRAGRAVWEQELALTRVQADSLLQFLRWNARDENKFYRYDYYLDNCSTRVRDALDMATGGALRRSMVSARSGVTWRGETLRLSEAYPLIAFGMTFALGRRADDTLTVWDEAFIPMRLRDAMRAVTAERPGGPAVPVVAGERMLEPEGQYIDAAAPPSYAGVAGLLGVAMALAIAALARAARTSAAARVTLQATGSAWHLVAGVAGGLVLLAGLFTRHEFMAVNTSVLLGTPVSLALVVLHARAWAPAAGERVRRASLALATLAAVAASVALLVTLIPSVAPNDWAPALLAAPVHVALAWTLLVHERARGAAAAAAPPAGAHR